MLVNALVYIQIFLVLLIWYLAVINARDEFEDVDLVFQSRQMTLIKNRKNAKTQPFFVKVGDELIRCVLEDVKYHPSKEKILI